MDALVGRTQEAEWLAHRLEDPDPKLILVCGQAGIGKTHLVAQVIPESRRLATISFPHRRFALPGYGLRRMAELDTASELREQLEEIEDAPLGWHLQSIFDVADELVRAHRGKVLVLDDLQWADELTLAWLSRTGSAPEAGTTSTVATLRTADAIGDPVVQELAPLQRKGRLSLLELPPLEVETVSAMASELGYADSDDFAGPLLRLTDGIPLAIKEVLRELDRRGTPPAQLATGDLEATPRLPVITAIVREQASQLSDDARWVIALACLAPQPASEKVVRAASAFDRPRFDRGLEGAASSGLIVQPRPGVIAFRHELQRESFNSELSLADRRTLNRRIAAVLAADPDSPAGPIAHHLVQAGQIDEALDWYLRAAGESMRGHDPGNALTYLQAALDVCPPDDAEMRLRLCEQVVQAARWSDNLDLGLELITRAENDVRAPRHAGRLMVFRARLLSYGGDFDGRVQALLAARDRTEDAADDGGLALALGELAFPLGSGLTLEERSAMGQRGLALAEMGGHPEAIALCAINLASATFYMADESAFALWERAGKAIEATPSDASELAIRTFYNWSLAAIAYGRYKQADEVLSRGFRTARSRFWLNSYHGTRALHLWRTGRWDEAVEAAEIVIGGVARPQAKALAAAIRAGILFEREPRPALADLITATRSLIDWSDEEFAVIAESILMRARAARREPDPARDAMSLVELIIGSRVQVGWDDLLPSLAEVDPAVCRRVLTLLGSLRPRGPRADILLALTAGLLGEHEGDHAVEVLVDSAERLLAFPEPYMAARSFEAAAAFVPSPKSRASVLRERAAEIYDGLGAHRSLAALLRKSRSSRASARFRIPQQHLRVSSPGLTPRERDVARLAARGHTAGEIGSELGIATVTVKKHLERIKPKLGVSKKSELIRALAPDPFGLDLGSRTD